MTTTYRVITGLADELIDPTLPKADVLGTPLDGLNQWLQAALLSEPDPLDPGERGPVTRWIGYAFGQPRMTKTQALALLPLNPGDPNPFFQIVDAVSREGGAVKIGGGPLEIAEAAPITRDIWMIPEYAAALVMTGGDAIGLPVWFEIDDPSGICPFSAGGEPWESWGTFDGSHVPVQYGAKWYRSNAVGPSGTLMHASEWFAAYVGGLKVISRAAFVAFQAAHTPAP